MLADGASMRGVGPPSRVNSFAQCDRVTKQRLPDDVAAYAAKVEQLRGQVLIPPQTLPGGDQLAIVLDTEGLSLGLTQRRT
jgi:predicted enzyme related to lactoylglutathione lyase